MANIARNPRLLILNSCGWDAGKFQVEYVTGTTTVYWPRSPFASYLGGARDGGCGSDTSIDLYGHAITIDGSVHPFVTTRGARLLGQQPPRAANAGTRRPGVLSHGLAAAQSRQFRIPDDGRPLEQRILIGLRARLEEWFGSPLEIIRDEIRIVDDRAFVSVRAQRPEGYTLDLSQTPGFLAGVFQLDARGAPVGGGEPGRVEATMRRFGNDNRWLTDHVIVHPPERWWESECPEWREVLPGECPG